MRAGLESCAACGKLIRPAKRKVPHDQTDDCRARRTLNDLYQRGYEGVGAFEGRILRELGVEVLSAPAHVDYDGVAKNGEFTLARNARLVKLFHTLRPFPAKAKRAALRALLDYPKLEEAEEAARRLGGVEAARAFLLGLVRDSRIAKPTSGRAPLPAAALTVFQLGGVDAMFCLPSAGVLVAGLAYECPEPFCEGTGFTSPPAHLRVKCEVCGGTGGIRFSTITTRIQDGRAYDYIFAEPPA